MIDLLTENDKKEAVDELNSQSTQSEIDKLMSEYSDAKIEPDNTDIDNNSISFPSENEIPLDSNLRFKRGKKKGELKPNWKDLWQKENGGNPIKGNAKKDEFSPSANSVISGALIMVMLDIVLPVSIQLVAKHAFKTNLKTEPLKLTSKESAELAPLAEKAAAQLNIQMTPLTAFLVSMAGVYTAKIIEATTNKKED